VIADTGTARDVRPTRLMVREYPQLVKLLDAGSPLESTPLRGAGVARCLAYITLTSPVQTRPGASPGNVWFSYEAVS
jgi:hypothetical protein